MIFFTSFLTGVDPIVTALLNQRGSAGIEFEINSKKYGNFCTDKYGDLQKSVFISWFEVQVFIHLISYEVYLTQSKCNMSLNKIIYANIVMLR